MCCTGMSDLFTLQQGDTLLAQHSMPTTEDEEFYEGDSPLEENTDLTESTENYENEVREQNQPFKY